MALPHLSLALPQEIVDKIMNTQAVASKTQVHDASRLREFLQFCDSHGIKSSNAFPAKEDLLVAWAASFSGRLAGTTVSAKLAAIKREHERRGLVWQGGVLLRRTLKVVEESRPPSSFNSKRASSISIVEDSNRGLAAAGDVKPAAPKIESDDSSQSDNGDDNDVKSDPAIILVEDSSESDSDCDVKIIDTMSGVNDCEYRSHTFVAKS